MLSEVIQYDPSKLMEMVRDRIRATYVSLIPEEQWTQLVKKEVDAFFGEYDSHSNTRTSVFRQVVGQELEAKTREVVKAYLDTIASNDWKWTNAQGQRVVPGDFVKQLFVERSGEMMFSVLGTAVQEAINRAVGTFHG